jgi:hypothetical protein
MGKKVGRKPHQHTPELARQVMSMSGYGITQADIATVLEIHPKTLRLHYRRELDTGAIEANARVAQALFKNATVNENVTAQIWWTKARMGWKEQQDVNLAGPGGGAVPIMVMTGVMRDVPQEPEPQRAIEGVAWDNDGPD